MNNDFTAINVGKAKIDLRGEKYSILLMKPTRIYLKEDGDLDDEPSLAIFMEGEVPFYVIGQISLKMFNKGFNQLGYKIVKDDTI